MTHSAHNVREQTPISFAQLISELQTALGASFEDVRCFIRTDLVQRDIHFFAILLGLPVAISMVFNLVEHPSNLMAMISADAIFFGLVAALLCVACREVEPAHKFVVSLIVLNLLRLVAPISALKLIILAMVPWFTQVTLDELKHSMGRTNDKPLAPTKPPEQQEVMAVHSTEPILNEINETQPPPVAVQPLPSITTTTTTTLKPTKKYIEARKHATVNLRQTLDLKGDRAYEYLIKRFRKHALGRFFERDFVFTTNPLDPIIASNHETLLRHENTLQIWSHLYSTEFAFVFPDDIMPKVRDIKWEIDTFLLYSALCRILKFDNETEVIFKYYNTMGTTDEDHVVVHRGHEGAKVVILPGENQPYLVRYLMKIEYLFNTKQNQYVDHITCKGLVDFKLTPYVALKQVGDFIDSAPSLSTPHNINSPSSHRMSSPNPTSGAPQPSVSSQSPTLITTQHPKRPSSALGSSQQTEREGSIVAAFVDSSLKK